MSATDLDNIVEGRCLLLQRIMETSQGRHEILAYRSEHGYMDGGGNYIVARLSHIHMIVGMDFLAAAIFSDQFEGAIGNHLISGSY